MTTETVPGNKPAITLGSRIERRMAEIAGRVYLPMHQVQLFEEHLTDDEKSSLFEYLPADAEEARFAREKQGREYFEKTLDEQFIGNGFRNICRLAELRNLTPEKLILDLAYEFGLLQGEPEFRRLVSEFCGEDHHAPNVFICYAEGELRVNGELVRRVKRLKNPSKIEYVLKSFEEDGWKKKKIDFKGTYNEKQVSDAVTALNNGLSVLKFSVDAGTAISWKLASEA